MGLQISFLLTTIENFIASSTAAKACRLLAPSANWKINNNFALRYH